MSSTKIISGDCTEEIPELESDSIDLAVTSPPYYSASKSYQRGDGVHYSQDVGEPLYSIIDASEELYDVVKDDGFFALNLGFSYGETGVMRPFRIVERILRTGWFCVDVVIWHKTNPIPMQNRLTNSIEYIFVFAQHPNPDYPDGIGYEHNFIETSVASPDVDASKSSAPYPVEIPEFVIENLSSVGDTVIDPYFGIGTTGVAASKLDRDMIGIEINNEYIEVARDRIEDVY